MQFMKVLTVHVDPLTSHVLTLKAHITKSRLVSCLLKHFEASLTNSVDPDQTAPISLIWSTPFASLLMLNNKQISKVVILLEF